MHAHDCIIDVGSGSVGVVLMETGKEKPILSKVVRVPLSDGSEAAPQAIAERAVLAFSKALEGMHAIAPRYVRIILAAPWYDATIRTILSKSEKPVRVTESTVARAVKEYFTQKGEGKGPRAGRMLIESVVSQTFVNGYPTSLKKPILGTALKINHYESEADEPFTTNLKDAAKKVFPHAKISFHSFSFTAFTVLRELRDEESFVLLDIGGEITEVAVAHHDGMRFIGTFPTGVLSLLRAVASNGSVADAVSRLTLFAKNELSNDETIAMGVKFDAASALWNKGHQATLEAAVREVAIPQTTFVFAGKDELPWLDKIISREHGAFSSRAVLVTPDFFHNVIMLGEDASYDAFLSLEAVFFHTEKRDLIEA